ncbi:MAG: Crp/Fnr family transcriptional regulator [Deltaproteobacteria bacterium]|jgi:CRP/FNR family transcriptional regulator|nr:Crp/Fnr family transcriptional regulator [Deltaproteobacteria bacterium]
MTKADSDPKPLTKDWTTEVLNQSLFFEGLSCDLIDSLASIAIRKSFATGQSLFERGDEAPGFYLVATGLVKIYLIHSDGRERILNLCGPGTIFGEAAVFRPGGYPASALAVEATETILFPTESIRKLLAQNPDLSIAMIGVLAQRLNHFRSIIEAAGQQLLPRLAGFLLELADDNGEIRLPTTKGQLALRLGTTAESLSRSLTKLKNAGFLKETKSHLIIIDRGRLIALAEGDSDENQSGV